MAEVVSTRVPDARVKLEEFQTENVFRDTYGMMSDEEWLAVLRRSMSEATIDGIEFPAFPSPEIQSRIHGNWNEDALTEAFAFYRFTKLKTFADLPPVATFLDFGAGWGRITRPFLRDFELKRMFGYEPSAGFCVLARMLNPYVCYFNGGYEPDNTLPEGRFHLVVGWSVFSHLSEVSARMWLRELSRVMRSGGYCVLTTWGQRFLTRLTEDEARLKGGEEIHWYSKMCLDAAGDIKVQQDQYSDGKMVWFGDGQSSLYGEAFLHPTALTSMLEEIGDGLELVSYDNQTLSQDAFVLRKR